MAPPDDDGDQPRQGIPVNNSASFENAADTSDTSSTISNHPSGTCCIHGAHELVNPLHFPPLGNMNQVDPHMDLWRPYGEGASHEIENGYPMVVDLQQLHLRNQICMSVDHVIEQQAFLLDDMEDIEEEHQHLLANPNITGHEFLDRMDETIDIVTANGEVIRPPLRMPARAARNRSPPSVSQRLADMQGDIGAIAGAGNGAASNNSVEGRGGQSGLEQYPLHNAAAVGRAVNDTAESDEAPKSKSSNQNKAGGAQHMGWQASKSTLKERFAYLYCNETLADVWFVVGRDEHTKRIPAHKFILITGSAVFDVMFNGGLANNGAEANGEEKKQDIELPDVEPAAFLALLKFLYTDDVSIGPEIVMTTLYTAKKYAVPAMELACVDFLKRNLAADNAFMLLTQARLFDEPQLASLCLDIIDKNTLEALNAEGFTEIDLETLCVVLKRDTLRVREAPLFLSVLRWSAEECRRRALPVTANNQRTVLGKALEMIRFPLMSIDEFAQHAAQNGILTDREVVSLFLYFTVNPKPQIGFPDVPRCCVFGKEAVVSRFQRAEGRWGYSGTPDRIKFTVDRRIYVTGFGLHGSLHGPHEYQVTIQILHCGTGKVLANNDTSFSCDGSCGTFRVLFREPVEISPCVTYIASACLRGPDSYYGTKGLRRIVHQSPSTGVVTFQFTYAAGNNNGTSVEDGQIPEIIFCTKII